MKRSHQLRTLDPDRQVGGVGRPAVSVITHTGSLPAVRGGQMVSRGAVETARADSFKKFDSKRKNWENVGRGKDLLYGPV